MIVSAVILIALLPLLSEMYRTGSFELYGIWMEEASERMTVLNGGNHQQQQHPQFKDTSIRKLTSSSHPVNFDDANGIHSLTSGNSHTLNSNKSFRPNNRQRSQREIIV